MRTHSALDARSVSGSRRLAHGLTAFARHAAVLLGVAAALAFSVGTASAASGSRTSSFTYNATTGILTSETAQPGGGTGVELTTTYVHDAFGNRTQVQVGSNLGTAVRTTTVTYEATGRFATGVSNPLSHAETRAWDARFGVVTSVTDPNSLTTTYALDTFGRRTLETRPDGLKVQVEYLYCSGVAGGTATCPTGAVYLVQQTPQNASGVQNAPWVKTYFDRLEREVQQETQGFDGTTVITQTEYDAQGRVLRKSLPRFAADPLRWVTYTYDALGRATEELRPDGTKVQTAFNGLVQVETAIVSPTNTRTRTTTRNGAGQVVEVKDHLNQATTFEYDPFGNLTRTVDPLGNQTTATYDVRGRRTQMNEPNLGLRSSTYNAFGEVLTETNARGRVTTMTYDKLGRMLTRSAPNATGIPGENASWTYDVGTKAIGKVSSATAINGSADYSRSHTYDSLGRPITVSTTIGTHVAIYSATYDSDSRLDVVTYPGVASGAAGITVRYRYTALGYEERLERPSNGAVFAKLLSRDAAGRPVQSEMVWSPNAVRTTRTWDQSNGRLLQMETTGPGGSASLIERHVYAWDGFGNLSTRATTYPVTGTTTATMSESFTYDALHRLTGVSTTTAVTGQVLTRSFTYNGIGNLTSRSDVGTYTYPTSGQGVARPHTPTAIAAAGGAPFALTTTFTYDADGNMLTGAGRTATWTSFSMPATISLGGQELRWLYGPERQRIRETLTGAAHTLHVAGFAGAYWERRLNVTTNVATVTNYLPFGGETVALVTETSTSPGVITTLWQLKDHLGSTTTLLDASGLLSGTRKSYDVWGKRRHVTGEDDTTNSIVSASSRDFTGHEFLEELRLVHMGGRIYDPVVARFLSPDPFVQDPFNLQNLNRYSYVLNNPLAYTDPDGFFFKSISKAFGKLQRFFQRTPIAALAVGVGVAAITGVWLDFNFFTIQSAVIAGSVSGALTDGLRGAVFGAVSGAITYGIGDIGFLGQGFEAIVGKAGLHGIAQGALAEAQGGEFGPAFLAASFAHAAGNGFGRVDALKGAGIDRFVTRTVAAAVIGGTASAIGGGKFQNGAALGAFTYAISAIAAAGSSVGNQSASSDAGEDRTTIGQPPAWGRDPSVLDAIEQAWNESNPYAGDLSVMREQGGWVTRGWFSGQYFIERVPAGTYNRLPMGAPPGGLSCGCRLEGWFHTHPARPEQGWSPFPSRADVDFTTRLGRPGAVRGHLGLLFFYPRSQ